MYFGKRTNINHTITLNGKAVEWAIEWVNLWVTLRSGKKFDCSITERIKKCYRCTNSIFRIDGRSNNTVMLRLIEFHCVPLLSYAIEVVTVLNRDERRQLRVASNSIYIFNILTQYIFSIYYRKFKKIGAQMWIW